jgi:hypothetical protein
MNPEKMKIPPMAVKPRVERAEWERKSKIPNRRAITTAVTRRGWLKIEVFIIVVPFDYAIKAGDR